MKGLYKFVSGEEIIYIGKSNSNIETRIKAHKAANGIDKKFEKYIKQGVEVFYCELPNSTEVDLMERALINKYKPILNVTDNHKGMSGMIHIDEPIWKPYIEDNKSQKPLKPKSKFERWKVDKGDIVLMDTEDIQIILFNNVGGRRLKEKRKFFDTKEDANLFIKSLIEQKDVIIANNFKLTRTLIYRNQELVKYLNKSHSLNDYEPLLGYVNSDSFGYSNILSCVCGHKKTYMEVNFVPESLALLDIAYRHNKLEQLTSWQGKR